MLHIFSKMVRFWHIGSFYSAYRKPLNANHRFLTQSNIPTKTPRRNFTPDRAGESFIVIDSGNTSQMEIKLHKNRH